MNRQYLIIPDFEHLQKTMELVEQFAPGFEYNDFCEPQIYCDETEVQKRCHTYKQLHRDRSKDTLHGVFLDMAVTSRDEEIRKYSRKRVEQSLDIAARLGLRGVVFHTGLIAELQVSYYLDAWLYESEKFFRTMAERYPQMDIYMENTFEKTPDMLIKLKKNMENVTNFKLCLDYGHACISPTPPQKWAEKMGTYVGHIHLNDNDLKTDLHQVPGEGNIDFKQCKDLLEKYAPGIPVLLELNGTERQKKALEYMTDL